MQIKPSDIHYSQDSICKYFDRRSSHRSQTIGQTLDQVLIGNCSVCDIPTISIVRIPKHGDKWFSLDNRRLWVFKQLERLGFLDKIEVSCAVFNYYRHGRKITTHNGGTSIRIRGDADPEGKGHSLPDQCYPKLQKLLNREHKNDDNNNMARKTISDRQTLRHHPTSVTPDNVTKPHMSKSTYFKEEYEYAGANVPVQHQKLTTSVSSQQSTLFAKNTQDQYGGNLTRLQTKTTQDMPASYSTEISSRMERYHTPRSTASNMRISENYNHNSISSPSAHAVFQRNNETSHFKTQRETGGNDDMTFPGRLSRLRVTDTLKESHRYSDISQENNHPIRNKQDISDIREKTGFPTKAGNRTHSIMDKTLKESETDRCGLYRTYTPDKSSKHCSPKINQLYNTYTKVLIPSEYTPADLEACEISVDLDHYEHTYPTDVLKVRDTHHVHAKATRVRPLSIPKQLCAATDEGGIIAAETKTDDRTSYYRPESKAYDSSKVAGREDRSSVRLDSNSGHSRQKSAKRVLTCTEEEVKINMSNLLFKQRHRHIFPGAWSTEAVCGLSDDSS